MLNKREETLKKYIHVIQPLFLPLSCCYLLKHVQHHHSNRVSFIHLLFHFSPTHRHQLCIIINAKKGMKITAEVFMKMIEMDECKKGIKSVLIQSTFCSWILVQSKALILMQKKKFYLLPVSDWIPFQFLNKIHSFFCSIHLFQC